MQDVKAFKIVTLINLCPLNFVCFLFALRLQKIVNPILGVCSLFKAVISKWIQLFHFISPLCHLWTWAGQACCSHPQSYQETVQLLLPPWFMLKILYFSACTEKSYFFPIKGRMFFSSICSIWLGSIAGRILALLDSPFLLRYSPPIVWSMSHTTSGFFQVKNGLALMVVIVKSSHFIDLAQYYFHSKEQMIWLDDY